jgi:hypothetical protein
VSQDELPPHDEENVLVFRGKNERPIAVPNGVALISERPLRAYELHQAGHTWESVAGVEGYPSGAAARGDVRRYMEEAGSLVADFSRKQLLEIELAKLLALQKACWASAMGGNLAAIGMAASLVRDQIRLLRLDQDVRDDPSAPGAGTVVIPEDEGEYSRSLQKLGNRKGRNG